MEAREPEKEGKTWPSGPERTLFRVSLANYYHLTKPGIVRGNALNTAIGFLVASFGIPFNWPLFFAALVGLSGVVASACVINNYADRELDSKMDRTKGRAFVAGTISPSLAFLFAGVLFSVGSSVLYYYTTPLALGAALLGFFVYVALYTPLKPHSPTALFVGAVAGAMPPVVGYAAVTNSLDLYALSLFAGFYLWQIPHFLAISMYRFSEYHAAGVPLYIKKEPSEAHKRQARMAFHASLVVLLLLLALLILQRWIR